MKKETRVGETEPSHLCQQFCTSLLQCDPRSTRGERAEHLLEVLHYMQRFAPHLPEEQCGEMITRAVLACGFDDELDAWLAMVSVLDPGKFVDIAGSLGGMAREETVD